MRIHMATCTFILCKPEAEGSNPFISTNKNAGQAMYRLDLLSCALRRGDIRGDIGPLRGLFELYHLTFRLRGAVEQCPH